MNKYIRHFIAATIVLSTVAGHGATTLLSTSLIYAPNPPVGLDVGGLVLTIDGAEIRYSAYVTTTASSMEIEIGGVSSFIASTWTDVVLGGSIVPIGDGLFLTQPVQRSFRLFEGIVVDETLADLLRNAPGQAVAVDFGSTIPATGTLAPVGIPEPSGLVLLQVVPLLWSLGRRRGGGKHAEQESSRQASPGGTVHAAPLRSAGMTSASGRAAYAYTLCQEIEP